MHLWITVPLLLIYFWYLEFKSSYAIINNFIVHFAMVNLIFENIQSGHKTAKHNASYVPANIESLDNDFTLF